MVIIDGKKFACQACVKGHRSSSCTHTNRKLTEIGKKDQRASVLPNGAKNIEPSDPSSQTTSTYDILKQITNPCLCDFGGNCCCSNSCHDSNSKAQPYSDKAQPSEEIKLKKSESKTTNVTTIAPAVEPLPLLVASSSTLAASMPNCHNSSPDLTPKQPYTIPGSMYGQKELLHPSDQIITTSTQYQASNFDPIFLNSSSTVSDLSRAESAPPQSSWAGLSQSVSASQISDISPENTLFAPQTAGTALCFCGIHCPCPGCLLHDPLGLKFQPQQINAPCPTSTRQGEGCIGGLDLPTVNSLLNLSPITESFSSAQSTSTSATIGQSNRTGHSHVQLPSVTQTLGLVSGGEWKANYHQPSWGVIGSDDVNFGNLDGFINGNGNNLKGCTINGNFKPIRGCCGGSSSSDGIGASRTGCSVRKDIIEKKKMECCEPGKCEC
ncbi:expressed protein [Phakopsora pachyrhizi]|uniref:Expressed protein n=1 Tax=Phakopsora pachyrhizi TaxID=170000 RepID=A0AAV0BIQ5_PHAPC|nr:expressed protein [Phakopsora pachyrhizi]